MSTRPKFKIAHSLQQLQDQLILTLKDQPLLKNNKQVNEDEDLFQNEEKQTENRMKHNAEMRKKIKEMSDVTTSHIQNKNQGRGGLLPHYDDHTYKNEQIQVQQDGMIKPKKPKAFKNIPSDFLSKQQSLNQQKLGAQYSRVKIKRASKPNQESKSGDLLSFLNQTAQDNVLQEQSDKRNAEQAIQDVLDSIRKKRITEFNAKRQFNSVDISSIIGLNQQEELLNKSIINAQRRKAPRNNYILDAIKEEANCQEEENEANNKKDANQTTVDIYLNPLTYTGEDKKYNRKDFDVTGIKSGTTSAMFVKLPSERLAKKEQSDAPTSFKDITPQELEKMRQQVSFLQDKAIGTGLSGTLQFLRGNALLNKQEQVGRNTDKSVNVNEPNDRIKLEYRNSNGKLMKPKQAFRYLCATFHGQGPGKNKVQKRKRKQLQQMKMKERCNTDGQLMSMLGQHQRKSNQAYMVIDMGKKAASKNI